VPVTAIASTVAVSSAALPGSSIERRARESHQPASFSDGEVTGPVIADVGPFFCRGRACRAPLELKLQGLLADQPLKRGNARLISLEKISRRSILVESARLILLDPYPDQIT